MSPNRIRGWRRFGVGVLLVASPAFGGDVEVFQIETLDGTPRLLVQAASAVRS